MIRSAIKASLKKVFGVEVKGPAAAPPPPAWKPSVPKAAILRPAQDAPKAETVAQTPAVAPASPVASQAATEIAAASPAGEHVVQAKEPEATPVEAPKAKKGKKGKEVAAAAAVAEAPEGVAAAAAVEPQVVAEATAEAQAPAGEDTVGAPAFSTEQVQELLDEMVRPALQGDGGDITLIRIESNDVYVKLVGSCSSCPSSIMTMKLGVEALMREELPGFGNLIQVD